MKPISILLFLFFALRLYALDLVSPSFENVAVESGLSNYNVGSISQDSSGYLWIATSRGLNRYDGENFTNFFFDPDFPEQGVPHDMILNVYCAQHRIFVRTNRGTVVYNQQTDKWHKIASGKSIMDIIEYNHKIYVVFNKKICLYDCDVDQLVTDPHFNNISILRIINSNDDLLWVLSGNMREIFCYDENLRLRRTIPLASGFLRNIPYVFNNKLMIKRGNGLFTYDIVENRLEHSASPTLRGIVGVSSLLALDDNILAITTMGDGLYFYHAKDDSLEHVYYGDGVSKLSSDLLRNAFLDQDKNLWISTFDKGIDIAYQHPNKFNEDRALNVKTKNNFINCILESRFNNDLLFGTRRSGILSRQHDNSYMNKMLDQYDHGAIISIFEDTENKLWIACSQCLIVYDQRLKKCLEIECFLDFPHVYNITQHGNKIYMLSEVDGIMIYDLQGKFLDHLATDISGVNEIIHCDSSQSYFCSINTGLYSLNRDSKEIHNLNLVRGGKEFDWEGAVTLVQQSDSILWLGTLSWGLLRVNRNTLESIAYTKNDGLPCNDITAIEIDDDGRLWLSTSNGLACMHDEGVFFNYSAHDGIGNYQFHRRSSLHTSDGYFFFGGNNGLTYFHPSNISFDQELKQHVIFEEISCNGQRLHTTDDTHILTKSIGYTKAITLPYRFANFSLAYTIPEPFAHDEIKYAYKLEGWDDQWHETKGGQPLYYSNLSAGDYTLLVKASRRYSAWSIPTSLAIHLEVAPWKSWWAYSLYALLIMMIIGLFFRMVMHRNLAQTKLLTEQNEHKRIDELNEMKHRFFTNISHELRTPLTIIHTIASVNSEELNSKESVANFLRNLRLNTERLLRLVDQLLTFRNLEKNALKLEVVEYNITDVIDHVIEPFLLFTQQKKLKFSVNYELEHNQCAFDRDKLEMILNNLLDNAIKYTSPGGSVLLEISEFSPDQVLDRGWDIFQEIDNEYCAYLQCSIVDTGIGIDAESLDHIFDRYYKASSNLDYSGTGIGLNFVKRLTELHKGQIRAESELGVGTTISVLLPLDSASLVSSEKTDDTCSEKEVYSTDLPIDVNVPECFKDKILLIVEDDVPLNNYLVKTFSKVFKVFNAYNSHEGLILAKNTFPDIIVSDVMMTEVDEGLKFCNRIKEDAYISHIPILLLTARTQKNQIVEGFAHGADAYVTKPFDITILTSNIVSLLENRARLQADMFKNELPKKVEDKQYNQNDIVFIKKINEIINEHYEDPKFNIASLSRDLLMSRSALYKKFTQITKLSPNEYLRKFRIKKSIELMKQNELSITQIVEKVGFSSRSGFYSSFKKEKDMTPSDYMKSKLNV